MGTHIRPPAGAPLSPIQLAILARFRTTGESNSTLAKYFGLTTNGIKYHMGQIYAKLGVQTRLQAATQGARSAKLRK